MVREEDTAHFFPVKNGPPGNFPKRGAGKNVQKIIPAAGQQQIEAIRPVGGKGQRKQKEKDKRLVMNLPENIGQKEVKRGI